MLKLQYTASAVADIESLVEFGLATHGSDAVTRYNKLIQFTVDQLQKNPNHDLSKEITKGIRMIHLRYFKQEVIHERVTVQKPSHFIFYRTLEDETLEIVRILHEGRNFLQHLQ